MRELTAIVLACMSFACGARTSLEVGNRPLDDGAGGGGAGGAGGGAGGAPACETPLEATRLAEGLGAARDLVAYGDSVYLLTVQALWRVPACGGAPRLVAENPKGAGSAEGLSVGGFGARWGANGSGSWLGRAPLDGGAATFQSVDSALAVAADGDGAYYLRQDGALVADDGAPGELVIAQGNYVGYWSPLTVDQGFVYAAWSTMTTSAAMIRARTDGSGVEQLLPGAIPDGLAVDGGEVFVALAHGIDQVQSFRADTLELTILASDQPTPTRVEVDAQSAYFVTNDGVRRVPRGGGDATVFQAQEGARELALGGDAVYWATDQGDVYRRRK